MATRLPRDGRTLPRVRAVSRAVSILRAFTPEEPKLSLSDIATRTRLDPGTIRRILITLRDEGLIYQDSSGGLYSMTLGVLELGKAVSESVSLRDLLEGDLITLASDMGATVYLSVYSNEKALCVARYHGTSGIEVRWWSAGESMPLNCGAGPRIILAYMSDSQRQSHLSGSLSGLTDNSQTDAAEILGELDDIKNRGWALTLNDVADGLSALAVPLTNADGKLVAAVSAGGLTPYITGPKQSDLLNTMKQAVRRMERLVSNLPSNISTNEI